MQKLKVLVVEDDNEAHRVRVMFQKNDWEVVHDMYDADIVCFVGGEDVDPALYGHEQHRTTYINRARDEYEMEIYALALSMGIPMVGICRGGQFLNVMNGGALYQDVDNHGNGPHNAFIPGNKQPYYVTSVHHQQMMVNNDVKNTLLLVASQSFRRCFMSNKGVGTKYETLSYPPRDTPTDVEAVFYHETRCLCFQPHPEYNGAVPTTELFFDFIDNYILNELHYTADEKEKANG